MTDNIRILLLRLDVLRQQHHAGIAPPAGEIDALFESARLVRQDVEAFDAGLSPAELRRSEELRRRERVAEVSSEHVSATLETVTLTAPLNVIARAVLAQLKAEGKAEGFAGTLAGDVGRREVDGGRRGS